MPKWDLRCKACGRVYELTFLNAADRDGWLSRLICERPCRGRLEVVPSAPAFRLVGSGFHKNDYPSKDK